MFYLTLISVLLIGFGDLRNVLTPVGYWLAWALWAISVLFCFVLSGKFRIFEEVKSMPRSIYIVFGVLVFGMIVSAVSVPQYLAFYQSIKLTVICFLFFVFYLLVREIGVDSVVRAVCWVLIGLSLFFLLSKYYGVPFWVRLGDGREGVFISYPGAMWKITVFFLPLLIANTYLRPENSIRNGVCIGLSAYLLILDGSRTGFLSVVIIFLIFILLIFFVSSFRRLVFNISWVGAIFSTFLLFFVFDGFLSSHFNISETTGLTEWTQKNSAFIKVEPLAISRLSDGDSDRISLLKHGWNHALECLPFGCGFETTASLSHGVVMPVHNAYLAAFGDFGFLGLIGMLGFFVVSSWPFFKVFKPMDSHPGIYGQGYSIDQKVYVLAATLGALSFCGSWLLHTFSSEMSEWGFFLVLLGISWSMARK
ncbi:O-antigen ligase family protein [Alcaligenes faecalis]|uniref:O-antigen ligase family protein n=1 Tax=Alcaligenes faecalis TaxID=511 RepID=UPI000B2A5843|nr:O-antigen ligase family protein [Alcaligenes faecalis]